MVAKFNKNRVRDFVDKIEMEANEMNRKEGKIKEFAEIRSFGTETSDETTNLANLEQWNRDEFLNTAKIESAINGKTLNTRKVHPI